MKNINLEISNKIARVNVILSLAIVAIHSSCISSLNETLQGYSVNYSIQRIVVVLSDSAVPLFFVMSAFLTFVNYDLDKWDKHIRKRFRTILIPYFLWSIFGWLFYMCLTHINLFKHVVNATTVSLQIKDIILAILNAEYNPPLWFLKTLFGFAIISPILFWLIKSFNNKVLFICIALIMFNIQYTPSYSSILFWLPIYLFGAWYGMTRNHLCKVYSYRESLISLAMFIIFAICIVIFDFSEHSKIYYLYRMISPILLWVALDVMKNKWKQKLSETFNISFFVFCTHIFIVTVFKKIFVNYLRGTNFGVTVAYFMTIVVTLFVIWSVSIFMKQYFLRIYVFLTGKR